jgi:hypothetical protein
MENVKDHVIVHGFGRLFFIANMFIHVEREKEKIQLRRNRR